MTSTSKNDTSEAKTSKSKTTKTAGDADAAVRELHGPGSELGGATLPMTLGEDVWGQLVDAVRADDRYAIADPNDPESRGNTSSAGGNPPPPVILQYGEGARDYVAVTFDSGQVLITDAADETGKTYKYPEAQWRRFVARVRGEELPDELQDPADKGPTQYEAAAVQNKRTFERVAEDREATPENKADGR